MTLLIALEFLVLAGWVCIVLYGFILGIMGWVTKRREAPLIWPRHIFAVLIPAENAEAVIGQTLERLLKDIRYPRGMFDLIVVPVNCKDRTPTVAKQKGAIVYGPGKRRWRNRNDAIQASLERLYAKRRYDACVILDTIVGVSPDFLAILSDRLSKGSTIIQSGYQLAGPASSWKAGISAAIRAVSPSLFTLWTSRFRLAVGLHRVGVCLSREVVEKYGVRSPAVTDGIPYMIRLLLDDVAVTFAPKAVVYDHGHTPPPMRSFGQQVVMRWRLMRQYAFTLIREGIQWRSAAQISGGLNLLLPPFSMLFGGAVLLLAISAYIHGMTAHPMTDEMIMGWSIVIMGQIALVVSRLAYTRAPALAYLTLPSLPFYYAWRSIQSWMAQKAKKTAPSSQQGAKQTGNAVPDKRRTTPRRGMRRQPSG